jgi:hypothetical protein
MLNTLYFIISFKNINYSYKITISTIPQVCVTKAEPMESVSYFSLAKIEVCNSTVVVL